MTAGPRSRWVLYALALVGTLAAGRWAGGQDEAPVVGTAARGAAATQAPAAAAAREPLPTLDLSLLTQRAMPEGGTDLFPAVSWAQQAREEQARRNPPPRVAPPKPEAPPLPFQYLGKLIEDGRPTVFLAQGDRNLIVREGETLEGAYRVDRIDEDAVTFTYLPLKQVQTLSFALTTAMPSPARGARAEPADPDNRKDDD